jgi:hypothetical protein
MQCGFTRGDLALFREVSNWRPFRAAVKTIHQYPSSNEIVELSSLSPSAAIVNQLSLQRLSVSGYGDQLCTTNSEQHKTVSCGPHSEQSQLGICQTLMINASYFCTGLN